jgi:membrane associated rhomboid family serine protease
MSITVLIILITVVTSWQGFSQPGFMHKYMFNAYQVTHRKEWYRLVTHGFLHADWGHLAFNMLSFYSFGESIERVFKGIFGESKGILFYVILYFGAMIFSSLYSLVKHKDNSYYNALGASGAVSAIIFTFILIAPSSKMYVFFLPMNSLLYGVVFLGLSYYMSKKNMDNIGHDAHFWGAVFGFVFPIILQPMLLDNFIMQVNQMLH